MSLVLFEATRFPTSLFESRETANYSLEEGTIDRSTGPSLTSSPSPPASWERSSEKYVCVPSNLCNFHFQPKEQAYEYLIRLTDESRNNNFATQATSARMRSVEGRDVDGTGKHLI